MINKKFKKQIIILIILIILGISIFTIFNIFSNSSNNIEKEEKNTEILIPQEKLNVLRERAIKREMKKEEIEKFNVLEERYKESQDTTFKNKAEYDANQKAAEDRLKILEERLNQ